MHIDRLEIAFAFNNISEDIKQITLLHCIGAETYGKLRDILNPVSPL